MLIVHSSFYLQVPHAFCLCGPKPLFFYNPQIHPGKKQYNLVSNGKFFAKRIAGHALGLYSTYGSSGDVSVMPASLEALYSQHPFPKPSEGLFGTAGTATLCVQSANIWLGSGITSSRAMNKRLANIVRNSIGPL